MNTPNISFNDIRNLNIGTVESVSPSQIKILLDINSPANTSLNTGEPTLFPKINGYVLIPHEMGAVICIITWIGIEHSTYPKRKGLKDFDLVDLPFPLRKMSVCPLGLLKKDIKEYKVERGVYSYPSVGDFAVLPTNEQLQAIVENKDSNDFIEIGHSSLAANSPVFVNPDKLFGRHFAVLGNTGSGKSCSVAGILRWTIDAAKRKGQTNNPNSRIIILDPNGEYTKAFQDKNAKILKVNFGDKEGDIEQLKIPVWMWNSYEWNSIVQASGKTQRPLLQRALRELKSGELSQYTDIKIRINKVLISTLVSLKNILNQGMPGYGEFKGRQNCGDIFKSLSDTLETFLLQISGEEKDAIEEIKKVSDKLESKKANERYYPAFTEPEIQQIYSVILEKCEIFGGVKDFSGPDEDTPVYYEGKHLPDHLERLAHEQNVHQYLDFLIMRIRTMLADSRMASIVGSDKSFTLRDWLDTYLGGNISEDGSITILDLSLVPTDILHIVISVVSRMVFEALQRYRRLNGCVLPSVLVIEEAHNFISKYVNENDDFSPSKLCTRTFETIAKEGRKFGLGLLLSSQRPAELSPTVLSQCNTYLLHRLANDKDQELVKKMVPDNLGNILSDLPTLPTRQAILMGWAAPIPILLEVNKLEKEYQPQSDDPDFWKVWTRQVDRPIDWERVSQEWQNQNETKGSV